MTQISGRPAPGVKEDPVKIEPIRRIVTGHDDKGRSIIVSDEPAPVPPGMEVWPTRGLSTIWWADRTPAGVEPDDFPLGEIPPFPPVGGTAYMIMQLPPESELDEMSEEDRKIATTPVVTMGPDFLARETRVNTEYMMHATNTVDVLVMLRGELTLLLDEGEVTLHPPDTVIQRATNHGWINRGTETALIAAAVISSEPPKI
jgi:hypothetical protein